MSGELTDVENVFESKKSEVDCVLTLKSLSRAFKNYIAKSKVEQLPICLIKSSYLLVADS